MFNFLEEVSSLSHYDFPLFFCIDHLGSLSYLSLLYFGALHSDGYIFPFFLCLLLLFFSQLFVRSDHVPVELWMEVHNIVQEAVVKTIPKKKKCKRQNCCLGRLYKQP